MKTMVIIRFDRYIKGYYWLYTLQQSKIDMGKRLVSQGRRSTHDGFSHGFVIFVSHGFVNFLEFLPINADQYLLYP